MSRLKRLLVLVLTVSLFLCGCTGGVKNSISEDENSTESLATETVINSDIKIGFIFLNDENSTYDLNFMNAAVNACKEKGVDYVLKTGIAEGNICFETACQLAEAGCDIVFADSFGHENYLIEAAKLYPSVQFCHATGTRAHTEGLSNYHNAFAAIYQGRYLTGIAAGMKLNEMIKAGTITEDQAILGYIGAYTYAEVISGYTAFYLGAKSVCPSVTMKVTFTGSWYDDEGEAKGARNLISKEHCVLISQHADSLGAPSVCENMGVPNISYNGGNLSSCPNTFLVASSINWKPYFEYIIESVSSGKDIESDWVGDLSTGSVRLSPLGSVAAEGTKEKIEEVEKALSSGSLNVFDTSAFTVDGEKINEYLADVDTDAAYTADTNAITDGIFYESEYRSAPYFDINIDGIELLDTAF